MTARPILLCILCQVLLVAGQIFLKRGMTAVDLVPRPAARVAFNLATGIVLLSLWFFLWLGLLQTWELSRLYPFEGLNPALLLIGASLLLKERVPAYAWIGIVFISIGVALVSGS